MYTAFLLLRLKRNLLLNALENTELAKQNISRIAALLVPPYNCGGVHALSIRVCVAGPA